MAMEILELLIFAFSFIVALTVPVHAQSQTGFVSLDCGLAANSSYNDEKTGINYNSDVNFTEGGVSYNIASEYKKDTLEQPFLTVRSFPEGMKNCYTLKLSRGDIKFLIRASFMYGNYDGKNKLPSFDLLLGAEVWDKVKLADASTIVSKEIIHVPQKNYIDVCLGNNGLGTPFISSLELRPIANDSYPTKLGTSLLLHSRLDIGSTANKTYRFKDDAYDRIWSPYTKPSWLTISTRLKLFNFLVTNYQPPTAVMQTAAMPANGSDSLDIEWNFSDHTLKFFAYIHFAELDESQAKSQEREVNTFLNGDYLWDGPTTPPYLSPFTVYSTRPIIGGEKIEFSFKKTEESQLPPILNAIELYQLKQFQQLLTNQDDVDAIMNIKATYGVKIKWQGDPCVPVVYMWQGLNCSYPESDSPRIKSLDLSSSGISGMISPHISGLTLIESLDLSYNNLTGPIPDFLSKLPFLTVLDLRGNHLQGSIPAGLRENGKYGQLLLRVEGNPDLCLSTSCTRNIVVPVLASFLAVSVLIAALSIMWILKTRSQGIPWSKNRRSLELNRRFSYSDIVRITDDFKRIIGKGGFGTVYHGNLNDTEVAVKMLSLSSIQGDKEFQTEVELLLRVHHKNLTTLVGYCDDGAQRGLIYEFMANGNLESHLQDEGSSTAAILSWEGRLQIATEAAQGLDYLHSGCKPPIVHRDVKPANILLNENFQAKISDFGLSRIFQVEGDTHLSTIVAGTPGYLDPEYYTSNRLTEKSDIYSFGVVLLQLITSKPAIEKSKDRTHIIQWVSFMLAKGDIENVVDPRLQGDFNMDSVSKAIKVAMACVSQNSAERPTMNQVVINLNESLAIEIARTKVRHETESKSSIENISLSMDSELLPIAR